jgi:hypothetical protein
MNEECEAGNPEIRTFPELPEKYLSSFGIQRKMVGVWAGFARFAW